MLELAPRPSIQELENPILAELNSEQTRVYLINCAKKVGLSEADAEDIAQEALIKANIGLKEYRGEANIKTWLYRIVLNCITDFSRKRNRRPTIAELSAHSDTNLIDNLTDPNLNVEDQKIEEEDKELKLNLQAQAILENLPPHQRDVMKLLLAGSTYKEIAEILGIPKKTVGTRIFHAKKLLAKILAKNKKP
jgi:RNA polymerase sigma-70 factor (ECF subfamily)